MDVKEYYNYNDPLIIAKIIAESKNRKSKKLKKKLKKILTK